MTHGTSRRDLLLRAGMLGFAGWLPGISAAQTTAPGAASRKRTLVLVELNGGNDGLNTVIPIEDPLYAKLRPRLGIAPDDVLPLADGLALHPSLTALQPAWAKRDMAVLLGVGYPRPNRSHFRSIEIWDTASDSNQFLSDGWVARGLRQKPRRATDAVVLGRPYLGPLLGPEVSVVALGGDPSGFVRQANRVSPVPELHQTRTTALDHVIDTQMKLTAAGREMQSKLDSMPARSEDMPKSGLGDQLATAAQLILSGLDVPVIKVSLSGFDTHVYQRNTHGNLLRQFAEAVAAFRTMMIAAGRWDDTLVLTYSEFGRRPAENGGTENDASSPGTDHGTAAPHFALGGGVRGGLVGTQPSLDQLDAQDLRHTMDFRQVFTTVARTWWGIDGSQMVSGSHAPIRMFA